MQLRNIDEPPNGWFPGGCACRRCAPHPAAGRQRLRRPARRPRRRTVPARGRDRDDPRGRSLTLAMDILTRPVPGARRCSSDGERRRRLMLCRIGCARQATRIRRHSPMRCSWAGVQVLDVVRSHDRAGARWAGHADFMLVVRDLADRPATAFHRRQDLGQARAEHADAGRRQRQLASEFVRVFELGAADRRGRLADLRRRDGRLAFLVGSNRRVVVRALRRSPLAIPLAAPVPVVVRDRTDRGRSRPGSG